MAMTLSCFECDSRDEEGGGWRAYLVDLDDDGEDEVAIFCDACASRKFGEARRASPGE